MTVTGTRTAPAARAEMLGIVAADATPLTRLGLKSLVAGPAGWQWLGSAGEARGVLLAVARWRPDVLLLDSALDPTGALTRAVRCRFPRVSVAVLLRGQRDRTCLRQLRAAGAIAVLPHDAAPVALLDTIRQARRRGSFVHPDLVDPSHPARPTGDGAVPLSPRERQVLQLVTEGLNNSDIGERLFITTETVRTHVKAILHKLEARGRARAVARAYALGIVAAPTRATGFLA